MSCKYKFINCGRTNRYIFSILIGAVFYAFVIVLENESTVFKDENENNPHPIVYTLIYTFSLCLSFIFLIIYKIRTKSQSINNNSITIEQNLYTRKTMKTICHQVKIVTKKEKFLWLLLVSIIDYIAFSFNSIFWITMDKYINNWSTNFLSISLFSYFILKTKLYKHHFVCIATIVIIGLLFNIPLGVFSSTNMEKYYGYYLSFIFTGIFFNLTYVLYKKMMVKKYIKSYEILFFQGIIESILGIITLIIMTKYDYIDNYWKFIEKLDKTQIIIILLIILGRFLFHSMIMIIIDIFSPFYVFLVFVIGEITFFSVSMKDDPIILISSIIFFSVSLFTILVFIELIELNCFGLSYMTKKNIVLRARLDSDLNKNIYEDDQGIAYKGYDFDFQISESKGTNELLLLDESLSFEN
jgi:hypothetical protein